MKNTRQKGFGLIMLMLALAIMLLIMSSLYFSSGMRGGESGENSGAKSLLETKDEAAEQIKALQDTINAKNQLPE